MKSFKRKVRKYNTKSRREKRLMYKVLFWVVVGIIVSITATWNHYTKESNRLSTEMIEAIKHPIKIEKAKAATEGIREVTKTITTKETIEQMIRRIAKEENFKWPDYLVKLAHCESRFDPKAVNDRNNKPSHSVDRGLFQINSYYHKNVTDTQAFDPDFATRWTIQKINEGKQHYWVCDKIIRNVK